ncbi:hypothetical protein [Cellulomonas fengjieae]|uniref:Type IV secretion protein Rhs n=1 Tax=Cellulomonas fengjieae TaxID=2819978 RepID=A0ABS3SGI2_9CELL|nr:hypothetical protein [Cellulomonas fengjieae]MBO3084866.1 hypothetical protein [Cellulomonas fengjieae]QVI66820.1 hypothetical protein KG102_04325 [Cellulomonas fengjieae]
MNGIVLWHKVVISAAGAGGGALGALASAFGFGLPLTISNSVYGLGLVLDADVTITAREGATATTFAVTVYDLPSKDTEILRSANHDGALHVAISLGYLDDPRIVFGNHPVLRGRIVDIDATIGEDGRAKVVLRGQEETGYLLLHTRAAGTLRGSGDLDAVVRRLLSSVTAPAGGLRLADGSSLGASTRDFTVRSGSVLSALSQLTELAGKALVVGDGVVAIGAAVGRDRAPVEIADNIVQLGSAQTDRPAAGAAASAPASPADRAVTDGHTVTVLGHPGLRVGQSIVSKAPGASGTLRISALTTTYSVKSGYVCELVLADVTGGARAPAATPATRVVDEFNRAMLAARQDNPAVDVGQVTAYVAGDGAAQGDKHRVTMHYAQTPARGVTAPSTDSPVSTEDELVKKPVASVFAFDKVGLVTPVYPGMRALLAHNRSLTNDAVVAGWLWPTEPAAAPPPNQAGDWWLALPTELGSDGRPTGKGVNDLVDARGARVLQARALHVLVGASALPAVGTRPTVPADDTITIEHASGTRITIDAQGAVSVTTDHKKLTFGNGQVSLSIDGSSVEVA